MLLLQLHLNLVLKFEIKVVIQWNFKSEVLTVLATLWRRLFFAYLATRGNHRTLHCLTRGEMSQGLHRADHHTTPSPPGHTNTHAYTCVQEKHSTITSSRAGGAFMWFFAILFTAFLHKISADLKSNRPSLTLIKNSVTWRLYYPGFFLYLHAEWNM